VERVDREIAEGTLGGDLTLRDHRRAASVRDERREPSPRCGQLPLPGAV